MKQAVEIFDGYGARQLLEKRLNEWLNAQPRTILGVQATSLRLFIHWRSTRLDTRDSPVFVKLFKTLPNGTSPAEQFAAFFNEHPRARVLHHAGNGSFLFWFCRDESD